MSYWHLESKFPPCCCCCSSPTRWPSPEKGCRHILPLTGILWLSLHTLPTMREKWLHTNTQTHLILLTLTIYVVLTERNEPKRTLCLSLSLPHPLTHTHKHSQVCAKYSWTLILLISETKWLDRLLRYHVCLARKHAPMLVEGASLELTYYDPWGERASRPFNDARFRLKCAHPCAIVARLNLFLSLSFRIVSSCQDFGSAGRRRFPVCPVLTG